jgi:hypothetical protein
VGVDAAGGDLLSAAVEAVGPGEVGDGVVGAVDVVVVQDLGLVVGWGSARGGLGLAWGGLVGWSAVGSWGLVNWGLLSLGGGVNGSIGWLGAVNGDGHDLGLVEDLLLVLNVALGVLVAVVEWNGEGASGKRGDGNHGGTHVWIDVVLLEITDLQWRLGWRELARAMRCNAVESFQKTVPARVC